MTQIDSEWAFFDEELQQRFPWYTSTCLEWLNSLDLEGKRVFEYGLGHSTLWYKAKGAITFGVDNDLDWCLKVGGAQCETSFYPYVTSIEQYDPFDIIVIDGEFRDDCTVYALENLKKGGYLIIDNYLQASVPTNWIRTPYLIKTLPITLYKEPHHTDWCTAVITKPS
jgi:hypothetical protein